MRVLKYALLPILISIIFFIIPFFWLKPGEMDLGGDSSRLYFYDPIHYLFGQSLFSISHSGFGGENQSYYAIPLLLLLALFKSFIHSPTLLISGFHGMSLSIAFISCYLIVKELLSQGRREAPYRRGVVEAASILAGLFYNLSSIPIGEWGYVILTFSQVFLNPLTFFLLLRFFTTHNMRYMLVVLLISVIFSPNFTFVGAPSFFAFYPLVFLFLLAYTKYIKHTPIPVKKLIVGVILFLLIQSFHLIPQIVSLLSPGSPIHEVVFSKSAKFDRGLGYFSAIAPIIKVSLSWFSLPQLAKLNPFSWLFIVFPALFVVGFIWNKRKAYLLAGIFFLIVQFFYSANITKIGFTLYVASFQIPGFSMFRNYYGQFQWAYLFFYAIFFGQALAIVMARVKKWQAYGILSFLFILLVITSWPFINGTLTDTRHVGIKKIRTHIKMDPKYEEVLSYIRALPLDGKILSLPLTDAGYQVLQGKEGGVYIGPSTITYLTNKNEFIGFEELGKFGQTFLDAARNKNYQVIKGMFSFFNIKYIFYNSDEYIYGDNFLGHPYNHVREFLPESQDEYRSFIEHLGVERLADFGEKYHIYEIKNDEYLPHIYVAKRTEYWNNDSINLHTLFSFYPQDKRVAFYNDISNFNRNKDIFDDIFLTAQNKSQIFDFFKTRKIPKFASPTVSRNLYSIIYPLVVLREKLDINQYPNVNDKYINRAAFFAEKRINELLRLGDIPILKNVKSITSFSNTWQEPGLWDFARHKEYNSWEITLVRYQKAIKKLIDELEKPNQSDYSSITNKVELKSILIEHKNKLSKAIREDSSRSIEEKKYLFSLAYEMFNDIFVRLNLNLPDDRFMQYEVGNPLGDGGYEMYVNKDDIKNLDITLSVDGKRVLPKTSKEGEWIRFDDVIVENKPFLPISLTINKISNLIEQTKWKTAELTKLEVSGQTTKLETIQQNETEKDLVTLTITYNFLGNGLVRDIPEWGEDSIYIISFDYLTYNQNFSMALYEKRGVKKNQYVSNTYNEALQSKEWKKFSTAILSKRDAQSAFLQITKDQDDIPDQNNDGSVKKIDIKNLSVVKIADPRIVFKKIVRSEKTVTPQIIFTKINPTKYKVTVRGAKDPYALVLSEQFNLSWKVFLPNGANEAKTLKGLFSRTLGEIITSILHAKNIVISSEASKENLTSHFNNDVIEGMHKNIFLDQSTFETFGQDPILEKTHLPVNGYANAWYIMPEDVQNKKDYELIIEMTSQKLFHVSLLISAGGLLLLSFMLLKSIIRK